MVPEWFAVLTGVMMWIAGLLTCGAIIGKTPFWNGIRDGFSLRFLWDYETVRRRWNGK